MRALRPIPSMRGRVLTAAAAVVVSGHVAFTAHAETCVTRSPSPGLRRQIPEAAPADPAPHRVVRNREARRQARVHAVPLHGSTVRIPPLRAAVRSTPAPGRADTQMVVTNLPRTSRSAASRAAPAISGGGVVRGDVGMLAAAPIVLLTALLLLAASHGLRELRRIRRQLDRIGRAMEKLRPAPRASRRRPSTVRLVRIERHRHTPDEAQRGPDIAALQDVLNEHLTKLGALLERGLAARVVDVAHAGPSPESAHETGASRARAAYVNMLDDGEMNQPVVFANLQLHHSVFGDGRPMFAESNDTLSQFMIIPSGESEGWIYPNPMRLFTPEISQVFPTLTRATFEAERAQVAGVAVQRYAPQRWRASEPVR